MAKKKIAGITMFLCAILFAAGCARSVEIRYSKWTVKQLNENKLPKFDIPIVINDRVIAWIDYFQGPGRNHFARYLARSGRYVPQMQTVLKKYALPQDLVYLALIESGFSAKAYSRARAAGHWQFIHGTGKYYGLEINNWKDERRDPEDSTVAAAKYLRDLFDEFGDWHLAMAAYNAGEGKIANAIRRNGTRNFWELIERDRHYLRAETKDYVPKFIAAAIIAKSPERFGFGDVVYDKPIESENSVVSTPTDLQVIAKCAGVSTDIIEDLNPELTRGSTPPNSSNYTIRLPKGTARRFEIAYAKIPESERLLAVRHVVKRGESIGKIARRHGVSVREILAANELRSLSSIKRGMVLVIPTGGAAREQAKYLIAREGDRVPGKLIKYRVKKGETLGMIAENFGVDKASLKKWNRIKTNRVHAGQVLKVYSSEKGTAVIASQKKIPKGTPRSYIVRRGDSWSRVAQKNGVSINELKLWNQKFARKDLMAGTRLRVYTEGEPPKVAVVSKVTEDVAGINMSDKLETPSEPIQSTSDQFELFSMKMEETIATAEASKSIPPSNLPIPETKKEPAVISYKIKNGDTIWDIAQKYKVSVKDIQSWNSLDGVSSKRLKPGDKITIKTVN